MEMKRRHTCSSCGKFLKYYDKVSRIVRTTNSETRWVKVERFRCTECGGVHRRLPEDIFPYKQYEAEIIRGVLEGLITPETKGYEDHPCEATMTRWKRQGNCTKNTSPIMERECRL